MNSPTSETEAIHIFKVKQVAKETEAFEELTRTRYFHRPVAMLVATWMGLFVARYENELAAFLGTSKDLLYVLAFAFGCLAFAWSEIAIQRRKLDALTRLVQLTRRE